MSATTQSVESPEAAKELNLLSKVELRIALADTDQKLETLLKTYLAPVLLKLASEHISVRNKVSLDTTLPWKLCFSIRSDLRSTKQMDRIDSWFLEWYCNLLRSSQSVNISMQGSRLRTQSPIFRQAVVLFFLYSTIWSLLTFASKYYQAPCGSTTEAVQRSSYCATYQAFWCVVYSARTGPFARQGQYILLYKILILGYCRRLKFRSVLSSPESILGPCCWFKICFLSPCSWLR